MEVAVDDKLKTDADRGVTFGTLHAIGWKPGPSIFRPRKATVV
jgi:hypothetical protein